MTDQFNWVKDRVPRQGKMIRNNGEIVNQADAIYLESLGDATSNVFRGRGFFWQHTRENLVQNDEYYYSFSIPAGVYAVVYSRTLEAGQGPVRLESVVGASFTGGTAVSAVNLLTGGAAAQVTALAGVTGVTGGVTIPNDFLFGGGNKVGVAGATKFPTIVPPNVDFLLKVTNEATGTNPGVRVALVFVEIPAADFPGPPV